MGGKSATTTSQVQIPPDVLARYNAVNSQAQATAANPFQQWGSQASDFVAQVNPEQTAGISGINSAAGSYQPYFDQATTATQAGMGAVNPGELNIDKYMSPYVKNVADTTAGIMGQQNEQAQSGALGQAASSGAFGGDRAGVAAANLNQQQSMAMGNTMANIMNQGYGQALGAAQQQQGVALSAEQANLARQMQGGQQMAGLGQAAQQAGLQGAEAQINAGTLQQQTDQAGKTALINQFMQQQGYPFQVAQFLANIAEGTGALSGSTTTTTSPSSFFSDRRLKEDVRKIGTADNGEPFYRFRYKGDPATHVGFMADQVEKHHPEAVGLDPSGYKTVDYDRASRASGGATAPYASPVGSAPGLAGYVPSAYLPVGELLMADPATIDRSQQSMLDQMTAMAGFGDSLKNLKGTYDWLKGPKEKASSDPAQINDNPGYADGGVAEQTPMAGLGYMAQVMDAQKNQQKPQLLQPQTGQGGGNSPASGVGSLMSGIASILPFFLERGGRVGYDNGGLADLSAAWQAATHPPDETVTDALVKHLGAANAAKMNTILAAQDRANGLGGYEGGARAEATSGLVPPIYPSADPTALAAGLGAAEQPRLAEQHRLAIEPQPVADPGFNPWDQPGDVSAPAYGAPEQGLSVAAHNFGVNHNDRAGVQTGLAPLSAQAIADAASPIRAHMWDAVNQIVVDPMKNLGQVAPAAAMGAAAMFPALAGRGLAAAGFPGAGQPMMDTGKGMYDWADDRFNAVLSPAAPSITASGGLGAGLGLNGSPAAPAAPALGAAAATMPANGVRPDGLAAGLPAGVPRNMVRPSGPAAGLPGLAPVAYGADGTMAPAGLVAGVEPPPAQVAGLMPPMTNQTGASVPPVVTPTQRQTAEGTPPDFSKMSGADFFNTYIVRQESGGHQFDAHGNPLTSSAGAVGAAQVMESTGPIAAKLAGLPWDRNRWLNDKGYNLALGQAYYNDQLRHFGDPLMAAAAYNAGPAAVSKAIDRATAMGGSYLDYLPSETQGYVRSISGMSGGPVVVSAMNAPDSPTNSYDQRNMLGRLLHDPKTGQLDKNALLSILSGIGTMASSPSRYLGAAALQGVGGFANTYAGLQKQAADIGQTQASTNLTNVQAAGQSFITAGPGGLPGVIVPKVGWVSLGDFVSNPTYQEAFSSDQVAAAKARVASEPQVAATGNSLFDSAPGKQAFGDEKTAVTGGDYQAQVARSADMKAAANASATGAMALHDPTVEQARAVATMLADTGLTGPGAAGSARAQYVNIAKTIMRAAGLPDQGLSEADDAKAILTKIGTAAAQAGATQAGQTAVEALNTLMSVQPGPDLTPEANAQIMSTIMMAQQKAIDRNGFYADFASDPQNPYHTVLNADKLFMSQQPRYDQERDALASLMKVAGQKAANGGPSIMEQLTSGTMSKDDAQSLLDYALQGKAPPGLYRYFVPNQAGA